MISTIGIIGFGRFGQFLAQNLKISFTITATSIEDYFELAKKTKIDYCYLNEFVTKEYDIIIIATSILSTGKVIDNIISKYPKFLKDQLLIDVLSVKLLPNIIFDKLSNLYPKLDLMLSHPMFGPDSAKDTWTNKKFVYYKKKIINETRFKTFINFFENKQCELISLTPENHDEITSRSQFLTHLVGRILENLEPKSSIIDTDGYSSLLKLIDQTKNDSWDLFEGLYQQNPYSNNILNKIISSTFKIRDKLNPPHNFISKIIKLNEELNKTKINKNLSAGIPSWTPNEYPEIKSKDNIYASSTGNFKLIQELNKFLLNNHKVNFNNRKILITSGGKQAIHLTIKGLTDPGKKWLIFKPYWPSFKDLVELEYGTLKEIEYYNKNELIKELSNDDTIGLILNRPNNPDNNDYDKNLFEIINYVKKYNKYLMADEVYLPLTKLNSVMYHNYDKIISIGSFSKAWGMTGWRVGWLITPDSLYQKFKGILSTIHGSVGNYNMKMALKQLKEFKIPQINKESFFKELEQFYPNIRTLEKYPKCVGLYLYVKLKYDDLLKKGYGSASSEIFEEKGYCRLVIK